MLLPTDFHWKQVVGDLRATGLSRMIQAGLIGAVAGNLLGMLITIFAGIDRVKSNMSPFLDFPLNVILLLGWFIGGTLAGLRSNEGTAKALTEGLTLTFWAMGQIVFFALVGTYRPELHVGHKNLFQVGFLVVVAGLFTAILVADAMFDRLVENRSSHGPGNGNGESFHYKPRHAARRRVKRP